MIVTPPYQREHDLWVAGMATHGTKGTGTASVLPMTDEEKAAVVKRPIGFAPAAEETKA